jgi:hypothetical protein
MYKSSRDRTAHWVQSHVPFEGGFYSPSYPHSNADGFVSSSPSDTDSTPPRMVLRYNDGRPDALIPRESSSKPRSRMLQSPPGRGRSGRDDQVPEEIRILPSFETNSRQGHVRSKSMPRTAEHGRGRELHMSHSSRTSSSHHKVKFAPPAQPSQPWHRQKQQPAVYPPHPGVFHHPPQFGPNGVIYSHSAPPATGYYPPQVAAPMRSRARYNPAAASVESLGTEQTYYIHMNRHKVHVIVSPISFRTRWCRVANGFLYEGPESCSVNHNSYVHN